MFKNHKYIKQVFCTETLIEFYTDANFVSNITSFVFFDDLNRHVTGKSLPYYNITRAVNCFDKKHFEKLGMLYFIYRNVTGRLD